MEIKMIETIVTEVPCNMSCNNYVDTYCEGMVTEDNKDKKKTNDIISG